MGKSTLKTVIITGANSGLGFETAKKIAANLEFRVILACRNQEKAEQAAEQIMEEAGSPNIVCMSLDTASLKSVRRFEQDYAQTCFGRVCALLCNAGISGTHTGLTEDGFDVVFQTNHLGHFLLTKLILPQMEEEGKIFVTSSDMHDAPDGNMAWKGTEALAHPDQEFAEEHIRCSYYKLCNLYFTYELSRRLRDSCKKLYVNAFNPGLMETGFMPLTKASVMFVKTTMPHRFGDLEKSSSALAELVLSEQLTRKSGQYYDRSIHTCPSSALSYDENNAAELWEASENYCAPILNSTQR